MIAKERSEGCVFFFEVAGIKEGEKDVNSAKEAGKVPVCDISL